MTIRLGAMIPHVTDGTSFYRGAGPLAAMLQDGRNFQLETGSVINWVWMRGIEVLFMQRPFTSDHVKVMAMAKLHGKPVWVDYDDDLFTVPPSNPTHAIYREKAVHQNVNTILAQADIVSCTTEALRTKFGRILELIEKAGAMNEGVRHKNLSKEKLVLLPNAYDEDLFGYSRRQWTRTLPPATKTVMWRGSNTHDADLAAFTDEIAEAFKKHGEGWTLNFVGSPFWQTIERIEAAGVDQRQVIVTKPMDPIEYFQYIHTIAPALLIVPLDDDLFNRSKSNIAWIEACHAGAMTLAPDWEEWRRPGVINYRSPQDFQEQLEKVLLGQHDREKLVRQGRDFIREHLGLENVNAMRWKILEKLRATDVWA